MNYISAKQLAARYSVSIPTLYRWIKANEFPAPVRIGPKCSRWREEDVLAWERARAVELS